MNKCLICESAHTNKDFNLCNKCQFAIAMARGKQCMTNDLLDVVVESDGVFWHTDECSMCPECQTVMPDDLIDRDSGLCDGCQFNKDNGVK